MLKSELIKLLTDNLGKYGDGEIKVEVLSDLNFRGKEYEIEDVTNEVGFNYEMDFITVIEKTGINKIYTNQSGKDLYEHGLHFTSWDYWIDPEANEYEVIVNEEDVEIDDDEMYLISPNVKVEFIKINNNKTK